MFDTIVWATDGSEVADRAIPLVTELARTHNSKLVAVHANELLLGRFGGSPLYADEPELQTKIQRQVAELRKAGFAVELKVETGGTRHIAELIADAAEEVEADLIVVATHGHLIGSVSKALLHRAPCPVLALPPTARPVETRQLEEATAL